MRWRPVPAAMAAARIARALLADSDEPAAGSPRSFPLAEFQEAAVRRARRVLACRGGVLVADEVGLGKTYVALALIEEALREGRSVVVIVPAALRSTWRPLVRRVARAATGEPGAAYLTTHARLSRGTHDAGRLARAGLVVVDEAHAFRNPATRRYRALGRRDPRSRLVLITATPVNNSVADLYHLVRQFARDDAFRDLGVASLRGCFLSDGGGGEDAARVARAVLVRRTRAAIPGSAAGVSPSDDRVRFPRRAPARIIRYDDARTAELVGSIEHLELAPYRALDGHGPGGVEALVRLGLLKRLESGRPALVGSLRRLRALLVTFAGAAANGRLLRPSDAIVRASTGDGAIQLALEELVLDAAAPGADLGRLVASARRDAERTARMLAVARGADPKLEALMRWLAERPPGAKTVLFTEFRDTAAALWRALAPAHRVGRVDGSGAWLGSRRAGRRAVVERFAPVASGVAAPPDRERVDVLIATDVLSEGLNLQDADTVVAYDLPWNPVRLLQRIGRVDRLGSPHEVVRPVLFVPGAGLDDVLRLTRSLRAKLGGIADTLGAGDAGELLARMGGPDAPRALDRLAPADPWERVREALARQQARTADLETRVAAVPGAARAAGRPLVGDATAADAVRTSPPAAWLVLARLLGSVPALYEVRADKTVRDAPASAADALVRVLGCVESGAAGSLPHPVLAREATAAARAVRRHLLARADVSRAPAALARSDPAARLAGRVRRAVRDLGPEPDPELLVRSDAALQRLARPLSLPAAAAVARLLRGTANGNNGARPAPPSLDELLTELARAAGEMGEAGAVEPGPDEPPTEPRVAVLAALRIRSAEASSGG